MKRLNHEQLIDMYVKVREIENMDKAFMDLLEELMKRDLLFEALDRLDIKMVNKRVSSCQEANQ